MRRAASLKIDHVTKRFGGVVALNDVSFDVTQGEIHGLIGPNGAGKTTLFNLITGIYSPTEGKIELNGRSLVGMSPHQTANLGIARTFQNIRLFDELSVYQNLITACQKHLSYHLADGLFKTPKYRREEKEIAKLTETTLQQIGLWELRDQLAGNLPYGQQRRLEIARALVTDPQLLLLDEPAAGMNEDESIKLSDFIRSIQNMYDTTILIIDHHMDVIMGICDHITVFNFGSNKSVQRFHIRNCKTQQDIKVADHVIECRDLGRLHTEVTKHRIPGSLWYRVKRLLESPTAAIMTFWMRSTFSLQGVSLKAPSPLIVNTPSFSSHSMPSMVPLSSLSASAPL